MHCYPTYSNNRHLFLSIFSLSHLHFVFKIVFKSCKKQVACRTKKMERFKEVEGILGSKNVEIILNEIRNGQLTEDDLKQIALVMGNGVHGVFVQNQYRYGTRLTLLMKKLLDAWFNNHPFLYKPYPNTYYNIVFFRKLLNNLKRLFLLNFVIMFIVQRSLEKHSIYILY